MNVHKLVGGLTTLVVAAALSIPAAALSAASAAPGDGSGSGGGGGSSGGADTVGSDYSDLNIVLRAADGTPLKVKYLVPADAEGDPATPEYCVQPISDDPLPGLSPVTNPLTGKDAYLIPLQGEWLTSPPDPLPVAEITACDPQPAYAMFVS